MIGGSSGLNGCAFIATSETHLNAVESIGNPGWDWRSMVPYYQKSYTLTLPSAEAQERLGLDYVDPTINGSSGPVQVSFPDAIDDPVVEAWFKTFQGLGFSMTADPFSASASGGYTNATTIDPVKKTRSFAGNSYYNLAKDRPNLKVVTDAQVQKINLNQTPSGGLRATGVRYVTKDGKSHSVQTRGEVIISGGTFNSPKLLELSGIGNPHILESIGIPTQVENVGVGENFQDHILSGASYQVQDNIKTKDDLMRKVPEVIAKAMDDYRSGQHGPFTVAGHFSSALLPLPDFLSEAGQAERESIIDKYLSEPPAGSFEHDLQQYVLACLRDPRQSTGGYFSYAAQSDFQVQGVTRKLTEMIQSRDPDNFITVMCEILSPLSRGSVHVVSADAATPPAIDPRWLSHGLDVEILARHVRYIDEIASSEPLKGMLKPGGKRLPSSIRDFRNMELDQVKDYVRASAKSGWHAVGTCSMMPREKGGVVDPRLRVYGVAGLRVVDVSILPIVPRGNTTSAAYAVAEKAADMIKEDWNERS